jgi:putative (di)nucleoside polyphosphate hydrolase
MKYRDNVCAVIRRKTDSSVLFCHRKGYPVDKGWQFPQGGIDPEADLIAELKRELSEEIGTDDITVIAISPRVYRYTFPEGVESKHKEYCGQQQQWVLAELNSDSVSVDNDADMAEFDDFAWVSPKDALTQIVDFKRDVYAEALQDLKLL